MAFLLSTVQFWSIKSALQIKDADVGCSVYHEKGETVDQVYNEEKRNYTESRGFVWNLSNKRPEKLRDSLKELEDLFATNKCVNVEWKNNSIIQILFGNGVFVYIFINTSTGDIEKISFDKYLVGKLHSEHVIDVVLYDDGLTFSFADPKLNRIQFNKKSTADPHKKIEKLNSIDPKVACFDLLGPSGRRLERKLSRSLNNDLLLVWWRISSNEVWPWTPLTIEKERANLQVYSINGSKIELACYCKTETEPLMAAFSQLHSHHIITVEQKSTHNGGISIERCIYEVTTTKLQRVVCTSIPLKSQAVCQAQNSQEDRLLLGCENSSLVLFDDYRRITITAQINFVPSVISWHSNDSIVLVGSAFGHIQCFDQALNHLNLQILSEQEAIPLPVLDLTQYFKYQPTLTKIVWNPSQNSTSSSDQPPVDRVILIFDKGPLACLTFQLGILSRGSLTPVELISHYIKYRQLDEAITLLRSLNWNTDGQTCFYCLTFIVNHLLRMPFTYKVDIQLEATLGTFYAPARPLTKVTILEYRERIGNLARKFFHHLLRHEKLEKASLLAVDIGSRDLFRDLYYMAVEKDDNILAEVALKNAKELEEMCITSEESEGTEDDESDERSEYSDSASGGEVDDLNHNRKPSPKPPLSDKRSSLAAPPLPYKNPALVQPPIQTSTKLVMASQNTHIKSAMIVPTSVSSLHLQTSKLTVNDARPKPSKNISPPDRVYTQLTATADLSLLSLTPNVDPNEQFVDGPSDNFLPNDSEEEEATGTVKVVHFGVV